jgi:hypothetical protein
MDPLYSLVVSKRKEGATAVDAEATPIGKQADSAAAEAPAAAPTTNELMKRLVKVAPDVAEGIIPAILNGDSKVIGTLPSLVAKLEKLYIVKKAKAAVEAIETGFQLGQTDMVLSALDHLNLGASASASASASVADKNGHGGARENAYPFFEPI